MSSGSDLAHALAAIGARGVGLGIPLHVLDETTSTNDEAKLGAKSGAPHGACWVAESQRAGRGRQGRVWSSPPGENLLFSVLLRLTCAPARLPPLALVAGLATRDAIAKALAHSPHSPHSPRGTGAAGADVRLKWPNDVLVDGRKIAGVLIEATLSGSKVDAVVVGIGINVHTRAFPAELTGTATSLAIVAGEGSSFDRGEVLADVLAGLARDLPLAAERGLGPVHARLSKHDALRGQRIRGENGEGSAEGIDVEGRLLVRGDDGVLVRWSAGEVALAPSPA